ncbi:MAG TPA: putative LPS assembly protein LptD, partial [Terriglobia bacterium]|nr:putative LPS assembly protein LptD [Terriglobia bacterium]
MLRKPTARSRRSKSSAGRRFAYLLFCLSLILPTISQAKENTCSVPSGHEDAQTTLTVAGDNQESIKNVLYVRGHVLITYEDMRMTADRARYNRSTGDLDAQGHVVFNDSRGHIEAESAYYNIHSDRGWFYKAHGYIHFPPPAKPKALPGEFPSAPTQLFVQGERIDRLDQDTYTIQRAQVSPCAKEDRGVAFWMTSAKIEIGDRLTGHGAVFQFLGLPMLYLPFITLPTSQNPRQFGFLLPQIGEDTQKGFTIGDGFFWPINPSTDLRLGLEDFSLRGLSVSGRFRALPSDSSSISASFFAIDDHASDPNLRAPGGSFQITGQSDDLGDGFRGVVNVDYVNTLAFRETWAPNFNTAVQTEAQQTGFASKNFDAYSLNFYASRYQDFLSAAPVNEQSVIIRQFPSVSFSGLDNQIGDSPFYFSFDTSA